MLGDSPDSHKYSARTDGLRTESTFMDRKNCVGKLPCLPFCVYLQGNQHTVIDPCIFATLPDLKT